MITLVYGDHGCGKSEYIYKRLCEDAACGHKAYLIVPEQMNVTAERRLASILPPSAQLYIEATSFTRLCNTVFRKIGGLSDNYATEGIRKVIMGRALKQVAPQLSEYSDAAKTDRNLSSLMLALADEFTACRISGEELDKAALILKSDSAGRKLRDISTVIAVYRSLLLERFDDPKDELARLADIPDPKSVFSDVNIYIDSFSGLTGVQHDIIRMLMKSSENLTISIPLPSHSHLSPDSLSLRQMSDRLRLDTAESGCKNQTLSFDKPQRFKSPVLANAALNLWQNNSPKTASEDYDGSIRLISAQDNYDEAEACAAEIRKLVMGGMRYSDIAVVSRNADALRGIIDRALEDASVPCFISEKTALSSTAVARLLLSALSILANGWQNKDVISHLKTGLCGFESDDCDLFELYCAKWRINGAGFTRGEWNMNPDGYAPDLSPRAKAVLERVNLLRSGLSERLSALNESIKAAKSCSDICAALYTYCESLDVRTQLRQRAERELETGHVREAEECSRVYTTALKALEELSLAYQGAPAPALSEFSDALRTVFDSVFIGSIPASCDCVTIGSADMLRADSPKCVILLGVYDGSFPSVPGESGLFSSAERETLSEYIRLSRNSDTEASDELYFIRRSIASASEKLIIFTRQNSGSVTVSRLRSMTGGLRTENADSDICDRICTEELASEYSCLLENTAAGKAIKRLSEERGFDTPERRLKENPVDSLSVSLNPESAEAALGKNTVLSQSKLQDFLDCPFRFYCKYLLKLDPGERASFSSASVGSFVHTVLEYYLREIYTNRNGVFPDADGRHLLIEEIVKDCLDRFAPEDSGQRTERLRHMSRRLSFLSEIITSDIQDELSDSDFVPKAFELHIGKNGIPPLSFRLKDGSQVSLEGYIDRVDVYEKDGKAYVRCVDYKTGSKEFKLENVEKGENLQLLLYLFSLTRGKARIPGVGTALELTEGAFTYLSTAAPRVDRSIDDEEGIKSSTAEAFSRSGALLADDGIASAISHSANDRYLMGKEKKRITLSEDGFDALFDTVSKTLVSSAEAMKSGKAAAYPAKGADSCKYCDFAEVCRSKRRF